MSKILACAHCAMALPVGAKFCIACGQAVSVHCRACDANSPVAALFCPDCGAELGTPANEAQVERRQVTVMFCDLVGSTAMTLKLDPEDSSAIYQAYENVCLDVMGAFGGMIDRYEGDGAVALFGYPTAREDAAECAIRAGLEVAAAVARLQNPHGLDLRVRIGIATGVVVVRTVQGGWTSARRQIAGEAVNLAARLQTVAEPGMVVVADTTKRLVGDMFRLRDLGQHLLKGFTAPVGVWAVEDALTSRSRFELMRRQRQTMDLIGRAKEAQTLLGWQRAAWAGQGQVVLISGEAGLGKSHLAAWLAKQLASQRYTRLDYQCARHHQGSALYPFIVQITHAAGLAPDDAPAARLDKLEHWLRAITNDVPTVAPLMAALLSIPAADRYPPFSVSSDEQRRLTLQALSGQVLALAQRQPVLILFEDLHWADATTLELLDTILAQLARLPVLAICTFRPEFTPTWQAMPHVMPHVRAMSVTRLDARAAADLIGRLTAPSVLPAHTVQAIVARADGIPLYLEELTRSVVEAQERDAGQASTAAGAGARSVAIAVPESLRDSLVERLDRLAPVKEIAQIGAAIGRDFSYELLRAVSARDDEVLADALAQLQQADILGEAEGRGAHHFQFRHALVQEAAYETLLKRRRPAIHLRIAETLERTFPEVAANEPEVLAHHYTEADQPPQAVKWWQQAGERAVRRSAYAEAALHFTKAMAVAEAMPASPDQRLLALRLQIAYGQVMMASRGYAAPESTAAFKKARHLAMDIEDVSQRFAIYYGLWAGSHIRSELAPMREMAEAFMHETQDRPGTPEAGIAHRLTGTTMCFEGRFTEAKAHLEQALAIYEPTRDRPLAYRFGHDVGVAAQCYLATSVWPLGETERAVQLNDEAIAAAIDSGHAPTMAYSRAYRCMLEVIRQQPLAAIPHVEALMHLSREHGMHWWLASGTFFRGWSRWHAGQTDDGDADMRRGIELCREHGLSAHPVMFGTLLAETEGRSGHLVPALARLDQAIATIARTGEGWFEAEVHRLRAAVLAKLHPDDLSLAQAALHDALAVAGRQQAISYAQRAQADLDRLLGRA